MPQTARLSPYWSYEQRPGSVTNPVQEYVDAAGSYYQDVQKSGVGQFLCRTHLNSAAHRVISHNIRPNSSYLVK